MRLRVLRYARGWATTKVNEDCIHEVKTRASGHDLGIIGRAFRWGAAVESELIGEYGIEEVRPAQSDKCAAIGTSVENKELYDCQRTDLSMPLLYYESLTNEDGRFAYPQMEPEKFHATGLAFAALQLAGSYAALRRAWFSTFACPGYLLLKATEDFTRWDAQGLILGACEHYVILWHVRPLCQAAQMYRWTPAPGTKPWSLHLIADIGRYSVSEVSAVSPARVHLDARFSGEWMQVMAVKLTRHSLIEVQAERGFKGIVKTWLELLYTYSGLPRPRPATERPLVEALIKHYLPGIRENAEAVARIMAYRFSKAEAETVPSTLTPENILAAEDNLQEDEGQDIRTVLRQVSEARHEHANPGASGAASSGPAGSGASASSGDPAPVAARGPRDPDYRRAPMLPADPDDNPSAAWAQQWLPPRARIRRDDVREFRWTVVLEEASQSSYNRTWNQYRTPLMALRDVLRTVWTESASLGRGECPHDLENIDPRNDAGGA